MLLKNTFDVPHRIDTVWEFFEDIPQVAACLPGAELTEVVDEDDYKGRVGVSLGPVKLRFHGTAHITERDAAAKRLVLDAEGADEKGRGQASLQVIAQLTSTGAGTRVVLDQDLDLSGAAAQYGRGMIADVTSTFSWRLTASRMKYRLIIRTADSRNSSRISRSRFSSDLPSRCRRSSSASDAR